MTMALEGGEGVSVAPRSLFTPGKDPVPIVQEAGWVPGSVWTGAENHAPTRIRSLDRPAHSRSLYRLSYLDTDLQSILASWRNHLLHLLNVHRVNDVRQTEIQTAVTIVPEPRTLEVKMAFE